MPETAEEPAQEVPGEAEPVDISTGPQEEAPEGVEEPAAEDIKEEIKPTEEEAPEPQLPDEAIAEVKVEKPEVPEERSLKRLLKRSKRMIQPRSSNCR